MIDVVLPVLDEAAAIPLVLASLPAGFRALVVDNGSTDRSADIARDAGARVVVEPQRGFGAACFAGLHAATSDVVCFMDCDASFDGQDLELVAAPVLAGHADLVLGSINPRPGRGPSTPGWRTASWLAGSPAVPACGSRTSVRSAPPAEIPSSSSTFRTEDQGGRSRWCCARPRPDGESRRYR